MAAWRSVGPDWYEREPWDAHDRLEAYGRDVGDNVYSDAAWLALAVEPGVTGGDGQVGTDPPTARAAA